MKLSAFGIGALALVAGVVPQFTDCASQGRNLTTSTGMTVAMKCHWTAMAEIALAVALGAVALGLLLSKSDETKRTLNGVGFVLGGLVAAVPTYLIGVCANKDMICNSLMKPTLIMTGVLIMAICLASIISTVRVGRQSGMAT
jgi:hypothetical protein